MVSLTISWLGLKNYDFHLFCNVFSKIDETPSKYKLNRRKPKKTNETIENTNKPMISVSHVLKNHGFVEYFMVWLEKLGFPLVFSWF